LSVVPQRDAHRIWLSFPKSNATCAPNVVTDLLSEDWSTAPVSSSPLRPTQGASVYAPRRPSAQRFTPPLVSRVSFASGCNRCRRSAARTRMG
jgi:hypothetical protein